MKYLTLLLIPLSLAFGAPHVPAENLGKLSSIDTPSESAAAATSSENSTPPGLDAWEAELNAAFAKVRNQGAVPEFYGEAKSRIETARRMTNEKPKAKETLLAVEAASIWTRAAVLQMQARERSVELAKLETLRMDITNQLNTVYSQIIQMEKGNAARLQTALEAEQRKARERQEEAARRFDELQSALIQVKTDARGTIISMSDILFDVDKATLTSDLKTSLAKIAGILTIYKDADVLVEGHTDNTGSAAHNQTLSERRAENVMNFMVEQGITQARLKSVGLGLSKPIADNTTKEGRAKNRRVDLVVMEKKLQ